MEAGSLVTPVRWPPVKTGLPYEVRLGSHRLPRRCLGQHSLRSTSLAGFLTRQGCRRRRPLGRRRSRNSPGALGRAFSSRRPFVRRLGSLVGLELLRRLDGRVATFATSLGRRSASRPVIVGIPLSSFSASLWLSRLGHASERPRFASRLGTQAKDPNLPVVWGTQAKDPVLFPPGWLPPSLPPPTPESKTR